LNITGTYSQASAGALQIELSGTSHGFGYDTLVATNQATLGGTLQVSLINSFLPALGNSFDILDASSITGTFATLSLPALGSGLVWNTTALYSTGVISVAAGMPGDYNNNGTVDAADYVLWRKGGPLANEVDNPGTVNAADYTAWRSRIGNPGSGAGLGDDGLNATGLSSEVVPEPQTIFLAMAIFAAVSFLRNGRRRK
jgi:hypothetical protein